MPDEKSKHPYKRIRVCKRCGHVWRASINGLKVKCPHCHSVFKR